MLLPINDQDRENLATALRCTAALRRHRCSPPSTAESTAAGHRLPPATVAVPSDDQRIWTASLSDSQPRRSQVQNPLNAPPRASSLSLISDACLPRAAFSSATVKNPTATLPVISPEHSLSVQTLESSHCCKLQWVSSSASSDLSLVASFRCCLHFEAFRLRSQFGFSNNRRCALLSSPFWKVLLCHTLLKHLKALLSLVCLVLPRSGCNLPVVSACAAECTGTFWFLRFVRRLCRFDATQSTLVQLAAAASVGAATASSSLGSHLARAYCDTQLSITIWRSPP
ncbi:hypothetical protein LR48_Vigan477s003400 [Vigna angularis]|uniref:Uncharacterized protein n=1 Tax=Phaseolus angularis TaxID=3914 RepID=A0A0L9TBX0_PHAAN|nr:hypothetical protein LR48_Vigan477s003400 [Vigna angularis]